ncbi:MAG: peptidoglycan-binding domain-containing protein [Acidobacteriota bacterium]
MAVVFCVAFLVVPAFASHIRRAPTAGAAQHSHRSGHARHHARRSHRLHGQQAIEPERVTEIQQALIKAHYLTGEPDGKWDTATVAAIQKYQADNGWQTKLMPDSRALEKLGLGPDYSTAINAKNSTFAPPPPDSSIPAEQAAGFAAAAGIDE